MRSSTRPARTILEAVGDRGRRSAAGEQHAARGVVGGCAGARAVRRERAGQRALSVGRADGSPASTSRVRPPSGLPATPTRLDPWDVVILSDVARARDSRRRDVGAAGVGGAAGGGLLVAGGESVFGEGDGAAGGYRHTPLERLTPVTFERKDEPQVALIIVLDRSWSMAGQSMELCKAAAQAAVDVHDRRAVGRRRHVQRRVRLGRARCATSARTATASARRSRAIEPGGHTLIYPAIEQAYLALRTAKARAKHVVLLSDGRSYPDRLRRARQEDGRREDHRLVGRGRAGRRPASCSRNIAKWGHGRSYVVADAKEVPQIFVKEAKNAGSPSFDEKPINADREESGVPERRRRDARCRRSRAARRR